jgi:hypothetical protein
MIVALVALSAGVAAAQYGHGGGDGAKYVDLDGDSVCDNIGTYPGFVDGDNDGVCDNFGTNGKDSDGDGVPNRQDDDYKPLRDGSGRGNGGHGKGHNQ